VAPLGGAYRIKVTMRFKVFRNERFVEKGEKPTKGFTGFLFLSIDPGGAGKLLGPGGSITETRPAVDIVDLIGKYAFGEVRKH
jgi:phospholipid/cholesterol/gamma-HCH transport system substrate-binding protein